MFFSSDVSVDALTLLIKADESVLRTVYIEYTTFKCIPASEEYQASTAYFLQPLFATAHSLPFFPLSLPQVSPPSIFFLTSPGAALRFLLLLPLFSYSKAPDLSQKAGQKGHPAGHPVWVGIPCSLQTSQVSISPNEVLGKHAPPPCWGDGGAIKISPD